MAGADLPNLRLALFEGIVVSLGAASGIAFAPRLLPPGLLSFVPVMPSPLTALVWLMAFAIVGWLGWRIHIEKRRGLMLVVWSIMFASLLVWRLFLYACGAVWLGAAVLALAALLATVLLPLVVSIGAGTAWTLLPLVLWLGYSSSGLIYLLLAA